MMSNSNEFIRLHRAEARSRAYRLFSTLLCEPDEAILRNENFFPLLHASLAFIAPEEKLTTVAIQKALSRTPATQLLVEYTKIFIGPFKVLAQPYSSMYADEPGLMTEETKWVEHFYQNCGLKFDYGIHDLPDHIVVELEFMSQLAAVEWQAISDGDEEKALLSQAYQRAFLDQHLGIWGVKLCDALINAGVSEYYRELGSLLMAFLVNERR